MVTRVEELLLQKNNIYYLKKRLNLICNVSLWKFKSFFTLSPIFTNISSSFHVNFKKIFTCLRSVCRISKNTDQNKMDAFQNCQSGCVGISVQWRNYCTGENLIKCGSVCFPVHVACACDLYHGNWKRNLRKFVYIVQYIICFLTLNHLYCIAIV